MAENDPVIKVFEYALNQERTGMTFFQNSLQIMGVGEALSAFEQLIEEEKKHIVFITNILDDLKQLGSIKAATLETITIEPTNFFDDRSRSNFLQRCVEGSMVPDVTVFNTAWLIEKDLSEFYGRMADKATGKAKDALEMLSSWEKEHEKFFREYRDKLAEVYANMPWGG